MQIYQHTDDAKTLPISICSFYYHSKKKYQSKKETHLENKDTSGLFKKNFFNVDKIFFGLKKDQQIRL